MSDAPKTAAEFNAQMVAIVDAADKRDDPALTAEEVEKYTKLEEGLLAFSASDAVRKRHVVWQAPRVSVLPQIQPDIKSRDSLEFAMDQYLRGKPGAAGELGSIQGEDGYQLGGMKVRGSDKVVSFSGRELDAMQFAQTETTTGGGYLLPTVTADRMVVVTLAFGGISAKADHINTNHGAPLNWPTIDDTANTGAAAAINAAPAGGGADLVFGQVTLGAFKFAATGTGNVGLKVPRELIDDAMFDITGRVTQLVGTRLGRLAAAQYATGVGTTAPSGLFNATTTNLAPSVGPGTLTYPSLDAWMRILDPSYRNENACWICNDGTVGKLAQVVDTTGRPLLLQNYQAGMGGAIPQMLLGYPVITDQACPPWLASSALNPAAVNTAYLAFGDFSQAFVIRDVQGISIIADPYTLIGANQVQYFGYIRTDSKVQNAKAMALYAGYHV